MKKSKRRFLRQKKNNNRYTHNKADENTPGFNLKLLRSVPSINLFGTSGFPWCKLRHNEKFGYMTHKYTSFRGSSFYGTSKIECIYFKQVDSCDKHTIDMFIPETFPLRRFNEKE